MAQWRKDAGFGRRVCMRDSPIRELSEYPRPWFYRPEIYYAFIIFPPVWSVLTLRSPWHNRGSGTRNILTGGVAWFFIIASIVFVVRWAQPNDDGERQLVNLVVFVPGLLLTLLTQVEWTAHRARHGPPPADAEDAEDAPPTPSTAAPPADKGRVKRRGRRGRRRERGES